MAACLAAGDGGRGFARPVGTDAGGLLVVVCGGGGAVCCRVVACRAYSLLLIQEQVTQVFMWTRGKFGPQWTRKLLAGLAAAIRE